MGKAHTFHDQRYKDANKINNLHETCKRGNSITATQSGTTVTVKCGCGVTSSTKVGGIIDAHDALADFHDKHQ